MGQQRPRQSCLEAASRVASVACGQRQRPRSSHSCCNPSDKSTPDQQRHRSLKWNSFRIASRSARGQLEASFHNETPGIMAISPQRRSREKQAEPEPLQRTCRIRESSRRPDVLLLRNCHGPQPSWTFPHSAHAVFSIQPPQQGPLQMVLRAASCHSMCNGGVAPARCHHRHRSSAEPERNTAAEKRYR